MSTRERLRAILRRVPFGLGVPGSMDHPTTGGLARDREQAESEPGEIDEDSSGGTNGDSSGETDGDSAGR